MQSKQKHRASTKRTYNRTVSQGSLARAASDYISIEEAAAALQMSYLTVYRLVKRQLLPSYRIGTKSLRISRSDLAEYMASRKGK